MNNIDETTTEMPIITVNSLLEKTFV